MLDDPLAAYPPMMSSADVAEFLGTTPEQLAQWRYRGRGPVWTKISEGRTGLVRYPREDLRTYIEARTTRPSATPTSAVS